ncbi:MAG: hypothetical protein LBH59_05775 [Planctomycetaceae bacterium]|nr:hypothetical protein [Planctomycetaceae bacterium]
MTDNKNYTEPVWAVGFALEQALHVVALTVFSYVDFKVASTYPKKIVANLKKLSAKSKSQHRINRK